MKKKLILSLGATAILFLVVVAFSFVNASNVEVVQVDPFATKMIIFNLTSGQKFTGSLAISGGSNDIDFWVTDPQGTKILDLGRVTNGKTFEFTAQSSGAYTFHFGNTFSWFTSKTVNLTYDVGLPTVGGIDFGLLLIIIGVVAMLLIVIGTLAVVFYRRKTKSKVSQTPPPTTNP